jgi:hypothetical protein
MIVSLTGHAIPSDVPSFSASSFAGLTAGGVECNSTIPGEGGAQFVPSLDSIVFLRVADFPADRARDTAPAVSRLSLALCAGSRDADLDRDPVTTPVALPGRRGAGAERHAGRSSAVVRERPTQA